MSNTNSLDARKQAIDEAARLGFKRILVPKTGYNTGEKTIQVLTASTLREAVNTGLGKTKKSDESLTFE